MRLDVTTWVRIKLTLEDGRTVTTDPTWRWIAEMALRDFGEYAIPYRGQRVVEALLIPHLVELN